MAITYTKLADVCRGKGDHKGARGYLEKTLRIRLQATGPMCMLLVHSLLL